MEFLVNIEVTFPPDIDPAEKARLIEAEGARARELATAGVIKRLWRSPGRWANWGLWSTADATELHEAISSLPMFPYLDAEVFALGLHPSDPGAGQ